MVHTPKSLGYRFPAEWEPHVATWLSWPHKEESWPGKLNAIYTVYAQFIAILSKGEKVCINVNDDKMKQEAISILSRTSANLDQIDFFYHPTNDAWCRDHGPAFLINPKAPDPKIIVNWDYNAWGNKYPPFDLDTEIPLKIADHYGIPVYTPNIIMEGGSVDFNGQGTILTTTACLLNPNRNPHLNQSQIEDYLIQYYGAEQVLWLGDGIEGDDTDGHVDDITRFVSADTVITMVEPNRQDNNYQPLTENLNVLKSMRLLNGKPLSIIEIPMPGPVIYEGQRLPASYANFYIANQSVIVPTYRHPNDQIAIDILAKAFPDREVIGLDSWDLIWGLGSFHCLSQQEPKI